MAFLSRFYFKRKHQFTVFVILLIFVIYYVTVIYNDVSEPQDLTRRDYDLNVTYEKLATTTPGQHKNSESKVNENNLNITTDCDQDECKRFKCDYSETKKCFPYNIIKVDTIVQYIENTLQEALKEDKGSGCEIPKLDPFAKEVLQFNKDLGPIECTADIDWVKCYMSKCKVVPEILDTMDDVKCIVKDILYKSDSERSLGKPHVIEEDQEYTLVASDHVKITCTGRLKNTISFLGKKGWVGHGIGYRSSIKPKKPPPGREKTINVLIFGFDSTSKNGFIRKMPTSYKVLTEELGATVLHGYNIIGDGTPAALFPILTGKTELELPEARKSIKNSGYLDQMPFIFYKLKEDGYRTAYFEDMPWIGTFQYRFNGFRHQPADHYLRAFYQEESNGGSKFTGGKQKFCVGDTPRFEIMMNITEQFLKMDGKRFAFTFVADITHDDFNEIGAADEPFAKFLRGLKSQGRLEDTLLIVMGDHGPRYANVRDTYQGKLEERLPLMAIRIPEQLRAARPDIQTALETNSEALTTPHDIHATVLDAMDMTKYWNPYKVKGADLPRGMTLFEPIPRNRSCSEAGIEPHWCTCLKWQDVAPSDPLYTRVVYALVDHLNFITEFLRSKCAIRKLDWIQWVMKRKVNTQLMLFQGARDKDGYVGKFGGKTTTIPKDIYQVKITVTPGKGIYEAAVAHDTKLDVFTVNTREISRTNAYGKEPSCISDEYPHLNMFCYCNT